MRNTFLLLLFLSPALLAAQEDWELKKEHNGIQIYVRATSSSSLKEFRGVTVVKASLGALAGVITDVEDFPQWMPLALETKIVEPLQDSEMIYYLASNAPWPVRDRDGVYRFRLDRRGEEVFIWVEGLPDRLPEKPGYERIRFTKGHWRLESLSKGVVRVTYQVLADPGGNIPAWLVNSTAVNQPLKTLLGLKNRVGLDEYQNLEYSFAK